MTAWGCSDTCGELGGIPSSNFVLIIPSLIRWSDVVKEGRVEKLRELVGGRLPRLRSERCRIVCYASADARTSR